MAYDFKAGPSLVPEAEHGRITLVERFERRPSLNASPTVAKNADWEILANAGSLAIGDCVFDAEGGVTLGVQDGTLNDDCILQAHLDTQMTAWDDVTWGTDQDTKFECIVVPRVSVAECIFWVGLKLTDTDVLATDDDQILVRYEDDVSSGALVAATEMNNAGQTTFVSSIFPAVGTPLHVQISFDQDQMGRLWVNGQLLISRSWLGQSEDLKPYVGVRSDATGSTAELTVRQVAISRKYA